MIKYHADGSVDRYKTRLVAKSFSQRPGFDYVETFPPTIHMVTIRTILAIAALKDMELYSIDISQAFINRDLDIEIYMQQSESFSRGHSHQKKCIELKHTETCENRLFWCMSEY